jgi:hypothetical protein
MPETYTTKQTENITLKAYVFYSEQTGESSGHHLKILEGKGGGAALVRYRGNVDHQVD